MKKKLRSFLLGWGAFAFCVPGIFAAPSIESAQQTFQSPAAAVAALADATANCDRAAVHQIFGPAVTNLLTGDQKQDSENFRGFATAVRQSCIPRQEGSEQVVLEIGQDHWPFPIPLVKENDRWVFDTWAGREEIVDRHIGRDELAAIALCRDYVKAQKQFAAADYDGCGRRHYAQRLECSPGKKDGLCWDQVAGESASPLPRLVSDDDRESGELKTGPNGEQPFHGYFFKILTRQGPAAPGGKKSFLKNGSMTEGFALAAYPAYYGRSGIMTFIVGPDGTVFQRDFGKDTEKAGAALKEFNPSKKWAAVREDGVKEWQTAATENAK